MVDGNQTPEAAQNPHIKPATARSPEQVPTMQEWLGGLEASGPQDKTRAAEIHDQYRYKMMPVEAFSELRVIDERAENQVLKDNLPGLVEEMI